MRLEPLQRHTRQSVWVFVLLCHNQVNLQVIRPNIWQKRRTFPQSLKTSASLRWKFPICSTGFSLPSKLDGCLESYSLSSWNELDEMPLFVPPHFFIRAERMTLALHCVVLHSYAPVPLSVICAPSCDSHCSTYSPPALVIEKYTVGWHDW